MSPAQGSVPDAVRAAGEIATWPAVAAAVDESRQACTALRWHQALRRRIPEAAAESRVRGAAASMELEGARLPVDVVRDLMRGAVGWHDPLDPVERVAKGTIAATAATESFTAATAPSRSWRGCTCSPPPNSCRPRSWVAPGMTARTAVNSLRCHRHPQRTRPGCACEVSWP